MADNDERADFLADIRDDPTKTCLRLAFAGWLEERDDALGEFIRLQCACHCPTCLDGVDVEEAPLDTQGETRVSPTIKRKITDRCLTRREGELLRAHGHVWLGQPPCNISVVFQNGLPTLFVTAGDLVRDAAAAWFRTQQNWVHELTLEGEAADLQRVIELGLLDRVVSLSIDMRGLSDADIQDVARLGSLEKLTLSTIGVDQPVLTGAALRPLVGLSKLRALHLNWFQVTDELLRNLAGLPQLELLEFSSSEYPDVTDAARASLAELTRLRTLRLAGHDLSDTVLRQFTGITRLRSLRLATTEAVTEEGLALLSAFPELEELELHRVSVSDPTLQVIGALERLRSLTISPPRNPSEVPALTDEGLARLSGLTDLQKLDLKSTPLTGAGVKHLSGLTQLRELTLSEYRESDASLEQLAGLLTDDDTQRLGRLAQPRTLRIGDAVTDAGIRHLRATTHLRDLVIFPVIELDAGFRQLAELPHLRDLYLSAVVEAKSDTAPLTNNAYASLSGLKQLRDLSFRKIRLTQDGLQSLAAVLSQRPDLQVTLNLEDHAIRDHDLQFWAGLPQLPNLTIDLDLDDYNEVTVASLQHLSGWTRLRSLSLHGCSITETGLACLATLTDLQELNIGRCDITDAGLACLAGLTQLLELKVDHSLVTDEGLKHLAGLTALRKLDLYRAEGITDAGLVHLAGLKQLERLNLAYSQITDAGLEQLAGLTKLFDLWLGDAPVTAEGTSKLKQSLVDCYITHQDHGRP